MPKAPDGKLALSNVRNQKVVKSNDLIQKSRFQLSVQEQKIILFLISKIKPDDDNFITVEFDTLQFCKICGIGKSGKNYQDIKDAIKALADKSVWISLGNGKKTLLRWIDKPYIDELNGTMQIKLDDLLKPYLLQLHNNFTQFELLYTLAMKSQYSIRLYEILRSYEFRHAAEFIIEELKELLSAACYDKYTDFMRYVIVTAVKEIENLSDINVTYEVFKQGRKYNRIKFSIYQKQDLDERFVTWKRIQAVIGT